MLRCCLYKLTVPIIQILSGCHYLLKREKDGEPVKLLSSTTGSLKLNKDPNIKCKFLRNGQSFNKYLSCEGEWRAIAADHLLSVFKLTTHYDTDVFLEVCLDNKQLHNNKVVNLHQIIKKKEN